jgi:hypothetical protein
VQRLDLHIVARSGSYRGAAFEQQLRRDRRREERGKTERQEAIGSVCVGERSVAVEQIAQPVVVAERRR